MSVSEFFTRMKTLWDEFDNLNSLPVCTCTGCSCNLTQKFYKLQQNQRLMQFLMKIDGKYSQVRINILMMPQLPTIGQAYRIVTQEEKHHELSKLTPDNIDFVAFGVDRRRSFTKFASNHFSESGNTQGRSFSRPLNNPQNGNRSITGFKRPNTYYYEHCKMSGHSMERRWKLNGYPPNHKFNNTWKRPEGSRSTANLAQGENDSSQSEMITTNLTTTQYK